MSKTLIALVTVIFHGANGRQEFPPGSTIERGLLPAIDEVALLKCGSIADPEQDEDAMRWAAMAGQRGAQQFEQARQEVLAERASVLLGDTGASDVVLPVLGVVVGDGTGTALPVIAAGTSVAADLGDSGTAASSSTAAAADAFAASTQTASASAAPAADTAADAPATSFVAAPASAPAPTPTPAPAPAKAKPAAAAKGARR